MGPAKSQLGPPSRHGAAPSLPSASASAILHGMTWITSQDLKSSGANSDGVWMLSSLGSNSPLTWHATSCQSVWINTEATSRNRGILVSERNASYSIVLLVAKKSKCMACYILCPMGLRITTPAPLLNLLDDPSTKIVNVTSDSSSFSLGVN